ncbi:MAG: YdeI/OmpD-associated family protein [Streptosporangiaceae bacterium]|nr:YdeI/OmpD-associated family protein [Streptosporangiaceae bacterium]
MRWVEEAKKAETRAARIARAVEALHEGKGAR